MMSVWRPFIVPSRQRTIFGNPVEGFLLDVSLLIMVVDFALEA
jgi:hypothetical protein